MTTVLAIDVGTTAVKAALVDLADGARIVELAERPVALATPEPGWAEQDPNDWWTATLDATRALDAGGVARVDAVAVTGQMQDLVAVDAACAPVRPAILYSDVRATEEHETLARTLGPGWSDAVGATPDASNVAAKWAWLARHEPDSVDATEVVLVGAHAFVVAQLTGRALSDATTAATTGLFDLWAGAWWTPVIEATRCPLPAIHAVGDPAGVLTDEAAARIGVAAGTPVVLAPGDAVATTVGVLGDAIDVAYVYLGTSGWVAAAAAEPVPRDGVIVLPGLHERHWIHVAPMPTACGALDWAREVLLGGIDHDAFDRLAAAAEHPAAADGVLFLPHLDGTRTPIDAPHATGVLIGMRRATDRATVAAAVMEGLAHGVQALAEVIAPGVDPLVACGGGAGSPQLCATLADVTGSAIVPLDSAHAAVLGAAVTAGLAMGIRVDVAAGRGTPVHPDPQRHDAHRRIESPFADIVPTMSGLFHSLAHARTSEASPRRDP